MRSLEELAAAPLAERRERGYDDTLREILQQPATWRETAALLEGHPPLSARENETVLLTGSGSSVHVGEALEPVLARKLRRSVRAVPAGSLLVDLPAFVPEGRGGILVSFARSGGSPESVGVVDRFLERRPGFRHLVVTCNRKGALATRYRGLDAVRTVVLPDRTCDRSLVMTSSFTNLWLAGRLLADRDLDVERLAAAGEKLLERSSDAIAELVERRFASALFLGSGARFGAARESALKVLEMSDGRVPAFAETFLGLRHGPMCAAREGALLVAFLASESPARLYELDLLSEIERKDLDVQRLLVGPGADIPADVPDDDRPPLDVLVGQLLGLFGALALGLQPDRPSPGDAISRVVSSFELH